MLRDVIGNGSGDCVLQQSFVGDETVTIDGLHLRRVEIHRHHADQNQHAKDYIQNRDASWKKFCAQANTPPPAHRRRRSPTWILRVGYAWNGILLILRHYRSTAAIGARRLLEITGGVCRKLSLWLGSTCHECLDSVARRFPFIQHGM